MNLNKREYSDGVKITSANLNAIQDNIINYCVPNYSEENNGQVLMIINGEMVWYNYPTAENTAF